MVHPHIGKNLGDDLADGKCTLPLIVALSEGQGKMEEPLSEEEEEEEE